MATTSPDNIWTPNSGDQYALVQDLGAMATSVQSALVKRANTYVGTSAQRAAFAAPEGTLWVDTNGTKQIWQRSAGVWVAPNTGKSDTGWVACTMKSGYTGGISVRNIDGAVWVKGEAVKPTNFNTVTAGEVVATLPGAQFQSSSYFRVNTGSYGSGTANGTIAVFAPSTLDITVFGFGASTNFAYMSHVSYRND